jgi:polysaccharide export outer membrane protein
MGMAGNASAVEQEYVLGAGDIIRVSVFQNPDLTVDARVSENGTITYPLLGSVSVGGSTTTEAERKIATLLRDGGFVQQPQVSILPTQVRGNQVAVLGQVNRPGRFPLETANNRISDILALAGGVTPTGSDVIVLTGLREGKPMHIEVDIPSMFLTEKNGQDITVRGGDILYVHRAPQYYIYGEVQRPGAYRIERGMTVMQALANGGGVTIRGTQRGLKINRRNEGGEIEAVSVGMGDKVQADDVIYVSESWF